MNSFFDKIMKYEKFKITCAQDPPFDPPLLLHSASVQQVPLRPEEPSHASFGNLRVVAVYTRYKYKIVHDIIKYKNIKITFSLCNQ